MAAALGVSLETAERRDALAPALLSLALQAARERAVLVLPRLDAGTGSPRLPSRVLLGAASAAVGRRVDADEIEHGELPSELFRRVPASVVPPAPGASLAADLALDERELDLALLLDRGSVSERGRAVYLDGLLGAAGAARRRAALKSPHGALLTPFDGQVDPARADAAVRALLATPIGPTALRSYIDCPFGFYARHLLGITVDEEPGLTLDIEPLDYGTLAHDILEDLYRRVAEDPLSAFQRRWPSCPISLTHARAARRRTGLPVIRWRGASSGGNSSPTSRALSRTTRSGKARCAPLISSGPSVTRSRRRSSSKSTGWSCALPVAPTAST